MSKRIRKVPEAIEQNMNPTLSQVLIRDTQRLCIAACALWKKSVQGMQECSEYSPPHCTRSPHCKDSEYAVDRHVCLAGHGKVHL